MKHGQVSAVVEGAQHCVFSRCRLIQHGQGLIRMGADDHMVEPLDFAVAVVDHDAPIRAAHAVHAVIQTHVVDGARQMFDIDAASPSTVRHSGRPTSFSRPWLPQKRMKASAG